MSAVHTGSTVRTACPLDCPDTCTLSVTVDSGRITRVDADRSPEANPFTQGFICDKVRHHARRVYGPDRVLTPLMRTGPKGTGEFAPIDWDAAIELVVARLRRTLASAGPDAVLPYLYNSSAPTLATSALGPRLWRWVGACDVPPTICAATHGAAYEAILGDLPSMDPLEVVEADLVVLWGANPAVANTHLPPLLNQARRRGARLVVVDPRRTPMAARADLHLPVRPGTDVVLAYAVATTMVAEGWMDRGFCDRFAAGVDEFLDAAAQWPVHRAAEVCGVERAAIVELARWLGTTTRTVTRPGWGLERTRNGSGAIRAVLSLAVLAGHFGRRGAGVLVDVSAAPLSFRANDPEPPGGWSVQREVNQNRFGALLTGADPGQPIEFLLVQGANPVVMNPDQNEVRRGLEREDLFTVVHDQVLTDTARYADVVLPATTHFEVDDVAHSYGTYTLQAVSRVIEPVGESRSNDQLAAVLAVGLGLPAEHFDPDPARLLAAVVTDGLGPGPRVLPAPGVQFLDVFPSGGRAVLHDASRPDPVPVHRELNSTYPLALISPASPRTINSMFGEHAESVPEVHLHPTDAASRGVVDGSAVVLHNDLGRVEAVARLDATTAPGVAVMVKGAWLRRFPNGSGVNALIPATLENLAGGACFNDARIEVTALRR